MATKRTSKKAPAKAVAGPASVTHTVHDAPQESPCVHDMQPVWPKGTVRCRHCGATGTTTPTTW